MAENKKSFNIYKITTIFLLLIIFVAIGLFGFNYHASNKFNQGVLYGQQLTNNYIVENLVKEGFLPVTLGNQTIALVPSQMMQISKEETILEIIDNIQTNGYVTLYTNDTQIVLVPYEPSD